MNFLLRNRDKLLIISLLALYVVSVLVNLGVLEFAGEEPRRAMISVEMLEAGNLIKPIQYGWDYYNKPPMFNWVLAALLWLTGSTSEFVLRLPSLLFYVLMAAFHYKVSRHFFPKNIALLSAFFVLTCADIYTYGLSYGTEIDIFYSLIVYLQAISIFWFYIKRRYLDLYLVSYLFCAVGFLTKAFPSLIFQGSTLAALCVYARSVKVVFRWQHLAGLTIFILVTGLYFFMYSQYSSPLRFLVNLLGEAFAKSGVGEQTNKLLNKSIIYPWLFFKMLLPWSLLLLLLLKRIRYQFRSNPLVWFSILFMAFNLWVYWFTGQPKIRYVYMFVPFGCTILVHIYQRFTESYAGLFNRGMKYIGFVFILVVFTVIAFPFFAETSLAWPVILTAALLALLWFYFQTTPQRIWLFIAGFMIVRLVYAALFIPLQRKGIESYNEHSRKMAAATGNAPVQYWADAPSFIVGVTNSLLSYQLETIKKPDHLPLEIPYYYYRNTGTIIRFDTVQQNTSYYIAYIRQLNNKPVDTLYSYFDKNLNQQVVLFKLKK